MSVRWLAEKTNKKLKYFVLALVNDIDTHLWKRCWVVKENKRE
jgi:hypothetical protein